MFVLWNHENFLTMFTLFDVWQKGGEKVSLLFWVLSYIFWVLSFELWVMSFELCVLCFELLFVELCVLNSYVLFMPSSCFYYLFMYIAIYIYSMFWGGASKLFFPFFSFFLSLNNSYVLSSSKRGRLLAQGYNHPVLEFWWLQNIYSYLY